MSFLRSLLVLLALAPVEARAAPPVLTYRVDLTQRADDQFRVTLAVSGLTTANAIYQFAATAPGTYQVMDIGRYVREFEAQHARSEERRVVSANQWRLSDPARVRTIRYRMAETWDTPVTEHQVYLMCGTSLEADHALINPHAVIGYPTGMQATPVHLRLTYPRDWKIGTSLARDRAGEYVAANYDELVDSPILLGRLSEAHTTVTGVPVAIYTYSKTGQITSSQLLGAMNGMLQAAGHFLGKLPVDRYTFLYHFEDKGAGAWEHSFSSEYVLPESPYTDSVGRQVTDIAAHEFFHVVTPLNIHSEIIAHFNFVTPVPSQHLWLYEGTTEWAAQKMQLEGGLKTPEQYLQTVITKMRVDRAAFDTSYSLRELALTSYSDSGQKQYANIYQRGAVTAGLLDLRLLDLSGGRQGLRDLILALTHKYGKRRAFPESTFVDTLVAMTDPRIRDFFDRYVWDSQHLPVAEYYEKLGIRLVSDSLGRPDHFEIDPHPSERQALLREAWLGRRPREAS